ncbi:MAG: hypothetical protein QM765_52460 [Myxococcales bacterium]
MASPATGTCERKPPESILAALESEARRTLQETEDAWRDLFEFGLRRVVGPVSLKPRGDAAEHDLVRFQRLEPLDDLFRPARLLSTAQSALQAMGLSPDAGGRISVDAEDAGIRPVGAAALPIDVPGEIAVVLGRLGGAHDYVQLFQALGRAHFFAMVSRDLPADARRFGDGAASFGALFDQLFVDAAFLERSLDADSREAIEAARLVAIERLGRLRHLCASLLYQRTLFAEGAREELQGAVPRGAWQGAVRRLAARALALRRRALPGLREPAARLQPGRGDPPRAARGRRRGLVAQPSRRSVSREARLPRWVGERGVGCQAARRRALSC